ncbi:putative AC transposase, partial [Pseudolycoriella hygida]
MDQIDENEEPGQASNNDVEENISETDDDHDCDSDNYHNEDENDPQATKKRSKYWQYFKIIVKDSGTRFAQCQINGCKKKYKVSGKSNGGTGNLARHLRKSHTEVVVSDLPHDEPFTFSQEKFRKALLKWIVACDQPFTAPQEEAILERDLLNAKSMAVKKNTKSPEKAMGEREIWHGICEKWIVACDQPFTAPQEEAFVELIRTLNPDAHIYSDKTIKKDELTEYLTKFDELKEEIAKVPGKISITMDSWTSKNWIPFLAIRGHWIDDDWNYKSKLLDFAYIEGNHSGEKHSQIFIKCVKRLKLPFSKILAITLDNASNNDTLFKWLIEHGLSPERNQVRCMPHIINLAAQDILKSLNVPATEDNADLED